MKHQTKNTRILIVGAGPSGLTLAHELYRHGITCRLIDQQLQRHQESRATDVQARTLEIFQAMGVLDDFLAQGVKVHGLDFYSTGRLIAQVPYNAVDSTLNFVIGLSQSNTERILEVHFNQLGGTLERGVSLTALKQDEQGVNVELTHADDARESQHFDWVIGCDGAHSIVRHSLGLTLTGSTFGEHFFLADVELDWDVPTDRKSLFVSDQGMLAVLPIPGKMRIFGDLELNQNLNLDRSTIDMLLKTRTFRQPQIGTIGWTSEFRVHTRMVEQYRVGRVFLVGDAAHIQSPIGGQGMNTSIQDAYNLAWKLALVARGLAKTELLDSYEAERRPIARITLSETDLQTRVTTWHNAYGQDAIMQVVGLVTKLPPIRRRFVGSELETTVHYRYSPAIAEHRSSLLGRPLFHTPNSEVASVLDRHRFAVAPHPGDRAPDVALADGRTLFDVLSHTTSHVLLLFDGTSPTASSHDKLMSIAETVRQGWDEQIQVHGVVLAQQAPRPETRPGSLVLDPDGRLHNRYGATAECLYLIRPDGYIGFRSQPADLDALLGYLHSIFCVIKQSPQLLPTPHSLFSAC